MNDDTREIHTLPFYDGPDHEQSPFCWCAPEAFTNEDGIETYLHRRPDGRHPFDGESWAISHVLADQPLPA